MFTIDLKDRTAIVTGAGRGLGFEVAKSLADCGANIVIGDIIAANAEASAKELEKMHVKAFGFKCDVTVQSDMANLFKEAKAKTGRIDIVVNAAGITVTENIDTISVDQIKSLIDINVMGTEYGCKLALDYMKDQGYGKVVNFSSTAGRMANRALPHYAMTKAAIINLTQSYAAHAAAYGINYNAVAPGIIRTAMWEQILIARAGDDLEKREEHWLAALKANIPMNKAQEAIDIANAVVFLCSDQARYITGQTLNVCGGMRMN
ncbi:MAG: SDR family oxidoreductase [Ruminococcaceae bacterium]|nr:SDR family oxidoreductase [Oscillospiraceae bacterium]